MAAAAQTFDRCQELDDLVAAQRVRWTNSVARRCGSFDVAEEVVQNAILRGLRYASRFRGECPMSSWMKTIIQHEVVQWFKRKSNRHIHCEIREVDRIVNGTEIAERNRLAWEIMKLAEQINPKYREAIYRFYFLDIFPESSTWKCRRFRGILQIRELLGSEAARQISRPQVRE